MARQPQRVSQEEDFDDFVPYEDRGEKFNVPPELIPEGMVYQWCRAFYNGKEDRQNLANLMRNRWTYVPADRPGHEILGGESTDPDPNGRINPHDGHIILEGLVLMERPLAIHRKVTNTRGSREDRPVGPLGIQQRRAKEQLIQGLEAAKVIPKGHLGGKERVVTLQRERDLSIPEDSGYSDDE